MRGRPRGENVPFRITSEEQRKGKLCLTVTLNGTTENHYLRLGFTRNPFPQIGKYELRHVDKALSILAADPIPHDNPRAYIARILDGWDEEFIDLCAANFRPDEVVKFNVYIPGPDNL